MIEHHCPSLGLIRGLRVKDYESVKELDEAAGEPGSCLRFANMHLVEKGPLVDGRDKFAEVLEEKTGFPMKMVTIEKKRPGGLIEKVQTPDWTEVQYVNQFRKAILSGTFKHDDFPCDEKLLEEALQRLADSLGAFPADAKRPERQPGVSRIPKWIKDRVNIIFNNGTQLRWWEIMTREQIPIAPLNGDRTKDEIALCYAIREREAKREAEEARKYA